ncbi:adenosine deaminase [Bifidobacterium lemurum]|nr:adenosine deaminase [Bifidobacterium lemurum]
MNAAASDSTTIQALRDMPKAELHLHIEGSLEPELALRLAARNHIELPYRDLDDLKRQYAFENLPSFLDLYYRLMTVLRSREDFRDLMLAYLERAHADGVRRAEIFFDPQVHMDNGCGIDTVMDGLLEGLAIGRERYGIRGDLIVCMLRDRPVESAMATLDAVEHRAGDLIGIGLDSAEVGYPPEPFAEVYARAAAMGLHRVAHAGEEGSAAYVTGALDALHVERVDHGIHSADDPAVTRRLADGGVALTCCPLSNLRLNVVGDVRDLPLRELARAGVRITVNSDDPAYFGGYIADNYIALAEAGYTMPELAEFARQSLLATFDTPENQSADLAAWEAWRRRYGSLLLQ